MRRWNLPPLTIDAEHAIERSLRLSIVPPPTPAACGARPEGHDWHRRSWRVDGNGWKFMCARCGHKARTLPR